MTVNTMLMLITATEFEMRPFRDLLRRYPQQICSHVCGVGPVEAATTTAIACAQSSVKLDGMINFGIGGAYHLEPPASPIELLELCLAEKECLGDFGICNGLHVEPFENNAFGSGYVMELRNKLLVEAKNTLSDQRYAFRSGTFVTVCGTSGSLQRGQGLQKRFQAICENMEGAALARLCDYLMLPLLEVRVISNMVAERDKTRWKIAAAVERMGAIGTRVVTRLLGKN